MPLLEFKKNHPDLIITVIPFAQTGDTCLPLSNAWLQWFLSANFKDIGAGQFNDIPQPKANTKLADCRDTGYLLDLRDTLAPFKLIPQQISLDNHPDLVSAAAIANISYCNEGGLISAKGSPSSRNGVGHTLCFGIRRSKNHPDKAIFGFFDANIGMLFMELDGFPVNGTEIRDNVNYWNDTRLIASTFIAHQKGLKTISHFLTAIGKFYDYQAYHCDKICLKKTRSPSTSPVLTPTRLAPRSPVLYSRHLTPSPRTLSKTLQTANSIRKSNGT